LGAPSGGDDLLGGDAPLEQCFDHQTAQVAGGARDDDGHVLVLLSWLVVLTVIGPCNPGPPAVTKPATPSLPAGVQALEVPYSP
jgi:hypothetical protein